MSEDSRKYVNMARHTPIVENVGDTLQRVEIITGTGRRRRWSVDAKAAIVAESFAPGASVSAVARHHDISVSLLFLWRRQMMRTKAAESVNGGTPPTFVPVAMTGCESTAPLHSEQATIEIELGAVRICIRGAVDRRALCEVLAAAGTIGR